MRPRIDADARGFDWLETEVWRFFKALEIWHCYIAASESALFH
jgi:hypothetical protein